MDSKRIDGASRQMENENGRSRRWLLKTGAIAIPTIVTLHASPAWATTDYTMVAYTYGVNQGKCRNPNFDPNSESPWKRDEFMPCEEIRRTKTSEEEPSSTGSHSPGPAAVDVIQF